MNLWSEQSLYTSLAGSPFSLTFPVCFPLLWGQLLQTAGHPGVRSSGLCEWSGPVGATPGFGGTSPQIMKDEAAPGRQEVWLLLFLLNPYNSGCPCQDSPSLQRLWSCFSVQCSPGSPGTLGFCVHECQHASMPASRGEHGVRNKETLDTVPPQDEQWSVQENFSLVATMETAMYHHCKTVPGMGLTCLPLGPPIHLLTPFILSSIHPFINACTHTFLYHSTHISPSQLLTNPFIHPPSYSFIDLVLHYLSILSQNIHPPTHPPISLAPLRQPGDQA